MPSIAIKRCLEIIRSIKEQGYKDRSPWAILDNHIISVVGGDQRTIDKYRNLLLRMKFIERTEITSTLKINWDEVNKHLLERL